MVERRVVLIVVVLGSKRLLQTAWVVMGLVLVVAVELELVTHCHQGDCLLIAVLVLVVLLLVLLVILVAAELVVYYHQTAVLHQDADRLVAPLPHPAPDS